jgi:URI fold toxin 2
MKPHANSHDNDAQHHLYEIFDVERDNIFKYGISGKPLNSDGSSPRANEQVSLFNRVVGMVRFFARILMVEIPGRKRAEDIETKHIKAFKDKYGHNPPGNV